MCSIFSLHSSWPRIPSEWTLTVHGTGLVNSEKDRLRVKVSREMPIDHVERLVAEESSRLNSCIIPPIPLCIDGVVPRKPIPRQITVEQAGIFGERVQLLWGYLRDDAEEQALASKAMSRWQTRQRMTGHGSLATSNANSTALNAIQAQGRHAQRLLRCVKRLQDFSVSQWT